MGGGVWVKENTLLWSVKFRLAFASVYMGWVGLPAVYRIRVVRKTVARATGYHGFFSGKNVTRVPSAVFVPAAVQENRWWLKLRRQSTLDITATSINGTSTPTIIATTTATVAVAAPPLASAKTGAGDESRALVVLPQDSRPGACVVDAGWTPPAWVFHSANHCTVCYARGN